VVPVLAAVAAFYGVLVPLRIEQHGTLWFAHIGTRFLRSAHTSPTLNSIRSTQSPYGYDGQFFLFIAADAVHARDYMRNGDQPAVRYARIVYPGLSFVASGGGRLGALPIAMIALNLLAIGGGTWAVALWLRRRGSSPWFAVLYGLWPGLVYAVIRDLSEPVAYCFAAFAVLLFDRRRLWPSAALLALSLLTRETTIGFVLAATFALALRDRGWRRPLAFVAAAVGPMVVWRVVLTAWLNASTLESTGSGWKAILPFYGVFARYPFDFQHWLLVWTVYLPLLLAGVGGLYLLSRRRHVELALFVVVNVTLFVVFLPENVTIDWGAAARNATPALLAALYCIPAVRSRLLLLAGGLLLSPLWYLFVAYLLDGPGWRLMTT
jgi:hypothetical protein